MLILDQIRKEKGTIRAVAYARYSSDMRERGIYRGTDRAISNYCANNDIEIVDYYIVRAKTATNTSRRHPKNDQRRYV
jgi:DNA invertase Pin-like site-specific DNA recombinase